mgnify:CR=1 FL=1
MRNLRCVKIDLRRRDLPLSRNWYFFAPFSIFSLFDALMYAAVAYVILRGIEEVLYLLMDIRTALLEDEPVADAQAEGVDDVS